MLSYELTIDMYIERSVCAWDQLKGRNVVTQASQNFARHPEGAKSVFSRMTVLYANVQFLAGHVAPPNIDDLHSNPILGRMSKDIPPGYT